MADFNIAIQITLKNEGGYVDNPADPGGRTKYGITQRDLDASLPGIDVASLTAVQATSWYQTTKLPEQFNNPLYWQIESQPVASKIFDLGVLFGVGTAVEQLQTLLKITPDGIFGQDTLATVNESDPASVLSGYKTLFVAHALAIGAAKPSKRIFISGWVKRVNS